MLTSLPCLAFFVCFLVRFFGTPCRWAGVLQRLGSRMIFVFANDQDQSSRWIYPPCCSMCAFFIVFLTLSLLYFYLIWMDLCWSQSDCRCICISNDSIWMGLLRGEPAGLPCLLLSVRPGSSICELLLPSQRLPRFFNFQIFACFLSAVLCMWSVLVLSNCLAKAKQLHEKPWGFWKNNLQKIYSKIDLGQKK